MVWRKSWMMTCFAVLIHSDNASRRGSERQLNWVQVVRFKNDPCQATSRTGTCYTHEECEDRGGSQQGSCANGFGVCCVFPLSCGGVLSENCTYFEGSQSSSGSCSATICPCTNNICQLRLDFDRFVISGPSTSSTGLAAQLDVEAGLVAWSPATACLTDTFAVSNGDGPAPPTICGTNSGEHMYVDSNAACNQMTFQFGMTGQGTSIVSRSWTIKVTQYACGYINLAPSGCTQYFFGSGSGTVNSYNYQSGGGVQLGSQQQTICVRRESGFCRICYSTVDAADFSLSGSAAATATNGPICCSYGPSNADSFGYDCVNIPNAMTADGGSPTGSSLCGRNSGLLATTICSTRTPFMLNFRSDTYDVASEGIPGANTGFSIVYFMDANNCN